MNSFGGNTFAGSVPSPGAFNPIQSTATSGLFPQIGQTQNWQGFGSAYAPDAVGAYWAQSSPTFQPTALSGAQGAANMGAQAAGNIFDIGGSLASQPNIYGSLANATAMPNALAGATAAGVLPYAGQVSPYASQVAQTAFDPQQQLYNRTLQQVQDQTRVGEAARGINMTPYGAGLENDQLRNFNIDWQNNQLGRQTQGMGALSQGASALSNLYGTALAGGQLGLGGNQLQLNQALGAGNLNLQQALGGAGLMQQAPGLGYATSQLPYQTQQGFGQNDFQSLMNLLGYAGGAQNLGQVGVQDWLSALGAGTQAQGVASNVFGNELKQNQQNWQQGQQLGQGIGSLLGGLPGGISSLASFLPMLAL